MDHAVNTAIDSDCELVEWLTKTKLHFYQQAIESFGYDTLESLTLMSEAEITDLANAIKMKPGELLP
jgi:hypothetical protein